MVFFSEGLDQQNEDEITLEDPPEYNEIIQGRLME